MILHNTYPDSLGFMNFFWHCRGIVPIAICRIDRSPPQPCKACTATEHYWSCSCSFSDANKSSCPSSSVCGASELWAQWCPIRTFALCGPFPIGRPSYQQPNTTKAFRCAFMTLEAWWNKRSPNILLYVLSLQSERNLWSLIHLIGVLLKWNLRFLSSIKMTLIGACWSNYFLNIQSAQMKNFFKKVVRIA